MRRAAFVLSLLAGSLLLATPGHTANTAPGPGEQCTKGGFPGPDPDTWPKPCQTVNSTAYECYCPVPADPMIPDASCSGTCIPRKCSPCPKATVQCLIGYGDCDTGFTCDCGGRNDCSGLCKAVMPKPPPVARPGPGEKCQILGLAEKFPPPPACRNAGGYEYTCKCVGSYDPNFRCNGTCVKQDCSPCPNATVQCLVGCGGCSKGFSCDCGGKDECCGVCKKVPAAFPPPRQPGLGDKCSPCPKSTVQCLIGYGDCSKGLVCDCGGKTDVCNGICKKPPPPPPVPTLLDPAGLGEKCGGCPNATVQCLIGYPGCDKGLFCDCGGKNACNGYCVKPPPTPPPSGQAVGARCSPCPKSTVECFFGYGTCAAGLSCDCGGKTNVCGGTCVKPSSAAPPPGPHQPGLGEKCSPCPNSTLQCLIGYGDCVEGLVCDCGGKDGCNGYCVKPPAGPLPGQKCTRPGFVAPGTPLPPACASPVAGYSYYCKCPPSNPMITDQPCTGVCAKQQCSPCPNATVQCLIGYGDCNKGYSCDCGGKNACSGFCKVACCPPVIKEGDPPCRDCGLKGL